MIRGDLNHQGIMFGVTGNVLQADIDDYFQSGVDDVILKPLSTEKFEYSYKAATVKRKYFNNANFRLNVSPPVRPSQAQSPLIRRTSTGEMRILGI